MCYQYKPEGVRKTGDIIIDDVAVAKNLTDKEHVKFIDDATEEATKKGMTLEKYLDELSQVIKAGFRKATKLDIEYLAKIRKMFNAGWNRNVAFAKGKIGDDIINLQSRSGKPKGTPGNFDNFKSINSDNYNYKNGPLKRDYDSEQKQIEYLYNRYKHNKQITGNVEIVSDLKICDNCEDIIDRFIRDFPNINVIRVWVRKELKR
ncbi:hypothetical protein DZC78_10100 [Olleya aquimaris]|nr:hypothetical protein DZC78_10100 [Olleya aquimaris]